MKLEIFLETEFLIVVDKPHGWLTTPARMMDDPRPCLGRVLQQQLQRQIFPVNRLDFEVSGLTLWAKDSKSHTEAQNWFEFGKIQKLYSALSEAGDAEPPHDWSEWQSNIAQGKKRSFIAEHGKPSVTRARCIGMEKPFPRWELMAVTGRRHQLRFEMSRHGFPILGDVLYGAGKASVESWIALRAVELNLADIPQDKRLGLPEVCRTGEIILPPDLTLAPAVPSR